MANSVFIGAGGPYSTSAGIFVPNGANLEYGAMQWVSNFLNIGTTINGGTARFTRLIAPTGAGLIFAANGTDVWQVNSAGNFLAVTDNVNDIGATGASRPANIFAGTRVTAPAYTVGSTAGASFGPGAITSITIVNGLVTAAS